MRLNEPIGWAALLIGLALSGQPAQADQEELFSLIAERLSWMEPVAAWKRVNDVPVEDLDREAVVVDAAITDAAAHGLDPDTVRAFFEAQIEAAKAIQDCWIDHWTAANATPSNVPDLVSEIRPELLRLGNAIIAGLAEDIAQNGPIPSSADDDFRAAVSIECLDEHHANALFDSLTQVRIAE